MKDALEKSGDGKLTRSPIVVVMGHVDHGKTTLLDYIKKTNIAGKEAGGITQAIGAYEVTHNGKQITFIDTPGHEAFSKMRSRGATAADLAILIVAADDGVKPQTKEVIKILKDTKTAFVVAINKIDKNNADPERVKSDLLNNEVMLEGYGGGISYQQISAKTGEGVPELLDLVLLATEMDALTYSEEEPASGFVVESKLDRRRGNEVVVILKNGVLRRGDEVYTPSVEGRVKILENFLGDSVAELKPSSPALIFGFEKLPEVGEEFMVGKRPTDAVEQKNNGRTAPGGTKTEAETKAAKLNLRLIIKADVQGSLEALAGIIKTIPQEEIRVEIMDERVGDVTDGDVKMAIAHRAAIIGFGTRVEKAARALAEANDVKILEGGIIYELAKKIEEEVNYLKSPKPLGELEVLAVFNQKTQKQLIGGKVSYGFVKNKLAYDVKRGEEVLGMGRISSLRQGKQEIDRVIEGKECGMIFESSVKVAVGDRLVAKPQS